MSPLQTLAIPHIGSSCGHRHSTWSSNAWISALVFLSIAFFPSTAHALPNPFAVAFAVDILFQGALVALLLIPKAATVSKRMLVRHVPSSSLRAAGLIAVLAAVSAILAARAPVDRMVIPDSSALEDRLQSCAPLSEQEAAEMGLRPNSIIVDVRPPGAFAAYHLVRSCNLTVDELVYEGERILNHLGAAIEVVYLAAEYAVPGESIFPDESQPAWAQFESLPGGLKSYYKNGKRALGWGTAPNLVVDGEGRPVNIQVGPLWHMGRYSALPTPKTWRRIPEAAFTIALDEGSPVVDLRNASCADGALCLEPWRAQASSIAPTLMEKHAGAVFVCNEPHECLLAASMGAELAAKGLSPLGYIVASGEWEPKSSRARRGVHGQLVPYAVLFGFIFITAASWHFVRALVRRLRWPRLRMLFLGACVLATLYASISISESIGARLDPEAPATRWMTYYLSNARLLGFPSIVASLLVAPVALGHIWERAFGRRSRFIRGATIVCSIAIVLKVIVSDLNVFGVALLCASVAGPLLVETVDTVRGIRSARKGHGLRWIPLSSAVSPAIVGGKAYWIGQAARDGMAVPESLILLGRPNEDIDRRALERGIRARLGHGPLIIRSSAPDEDEEGSLTAGRYLSIPIDSVEEAFEAVRSVFADYVAKGIDGNAQAAVLIQHKMEAQWAGIAVRAPKHRGGGILVECSRGTNVGITAGKRAERAGTIGPISKRWLEEENVPPIPEKVLVEVFERYEPRLGGPIQIEWAWERGTLILFQVRRAPNEASPLLPFDSASGALERMQASLTWISRRPTAPVLRAGELIDYGASTSRATEELLTMMWDRDQGHLHAVRLLRNHALPKPPKPVVVRIEGRLFENLTSDTPVRRLLSLPLHRLGRMWLRARVDSRIALIQSELERLANKPIGIGGSCPREPRDAARQILELRKRLVEGPGAIAVAVSLLGQMSRGRRLNTPRLLGDPLLSDLAAGLGARELANRYPRRALPDLALERPRLGEGMPPNEAAAHFGSPPESAFESIDERLAYLRGRARVILAEYAAELRQSYLQLGRLLQRNDVFEFSEDMLRELSRSDATSVPPMPTREHQQSTPLMVRLIDLERWASFGKVLSEPATQRSASGFWVGDPVRGDCVVINPDEKWIGEGRPLLIVDVPTVELMASIARDVVVVARAGTRLCHAAMIACERKISALFGAGDGVLQFVVGERVRVFESGEIDRIDEHSLPHFGNPASIAGSYTVSSERDDRSRGETSRHSPPTPSGMGKG